MPESSESLREARGEDGAARGDKLCSRLSRGPEGTPVRGRTHSPGPADEWLQPPWEPPRALPRVETETSATITGEAAAEGFLQVSCWQWVFGPKLGPFPSFLPQ